jgi:hypothetical protein
MRPLLAALCLLIPALAGAADGGQVPLTPFETKKTSLEGGAPERGGPKHKGLTRDAAPEGDALVCEKDVVHPTTKPGAMGVRHCWMKSDPKTIIEKPFNFMTADDVRGAVQGGAGGFPPLKKPRIPPAKKKAPVRKAPAQ